MFIRFRRKTARPDLHDLPDHELIQLYRESGEAEIIAILFQRYTHLVYGVSLKYLEDSDDAKDAVMEIFEDLMEKLLKHDIHNFKSWLHSVTRNHCLMKLRGRRPVYSDTDRMDENNLSEIMEFGEDAHQSIGIGRITQEALEKAMNSLKEPQRRCVELVYLHGKSYQEVCVLTGYTEKEVKSHVQNGKRNLKIRLENNVGEV